MAGARKRSAGAGGANTAGGSPPAEPLVVLTALVLRADTSPESGLRRARRGYAVNRAGEGIADPGSDDRQLALTAEPQLEWEAFDAYWRKVHGPKILHPEGDDDGITPLLVYYLQQHRIPGGPTSQEPPPYRAPVGADGRLPPDPAARVRGYDRPPWDGLAQLGFRSAEELRRFFDPGPGKYGEKIVPDEAVFLRGFAFNLSEEHVVLGGDRRRDSILLVVTHVRRDGLTRRAFRERWGGAHADRLRSLPQAKPGGSLRRYAQLHNVSAAGDAFYDEVGDRFDGIGVMSFANINDLEDFLASSDYAGLAADADEFCTEVAYFTALNYAIRAG